MPRAIARSMFAAGMFAAFAVSTAVLRRTFASGLPPPWRAAIVISLISREKILPRSWSALPFLRLIVDHLE